MIAPSLAFMLGANFCWGVHHSARQSEIPGRCWVCEEEAWPPDLKATETRSTASPDKGFRPNFLQFSAWLSRIRGNSLGFSTLRAKIIITTVWQRPAPPIFLPLKCLHFPRSKSSMTAPILARLLGTWPPTKRCFGTPRAWRYCATTRGRSPAGAWAACNRLPIWQSKGRRDDRSFVVSREVEQSPTAPES